MEGGRATVHDVARVAGVGKSTVSNVLNHPERVDGPTAERVLRAIEDLGYVRNSAARQLRLGASETIGFILLDSTSPFYWSLEQVIEAAAEERSYSLLIANSGQDHARELRHLRALQTHRANGVIVTPTTAEVESFRAADAAGMPIVLVDYPHAVPGMAVISIDHRSAGRTAARHLLTRGHRRIALVELRPSGNFLVDERNRGAAEEIASTAGAAVERLPVERLDQRGAEAIVHALLASADRPTALFAPNDVIAAAVADLLLDHALHVPQDLAIVGYDDRSFPSTRGSTLTTMRQDPAAIGRSAVEALLARIDGTSARESRVQFVPQLVERASA